jgi:hypothetical protein
MSYSPHTIGHTRGRPYGAVKQIGRAVLLDACSRLCGGVACSGAGEVPPMSQQTTAARRAPKRWQRKWRLSRKEVSGAGAQHVAWRSSHTPRATSGGSSAPFPWARGGTRGELRISARRLLRYHGRCRRARLRAASNFRSDLHLGSQGTACIKDPSSSPSKRGIVQRPSRSAPLSATLLVSSRARSCGMAGHADPTRPSALEPAGRHHRVLRTAEQQHTVGGHDH